MDGSGRNEEEQESDQSRGDQNNLAMGKNWEAAKGTSHTQNYRITEH